MVFSLWMVGDDVNFLHWTFTSWNSFAWFASEDQDLSTWPPSHHWSSCHVVSTKEARGLGATLRGVAGLKCDRLGWGLDWSGEVGREESLLACWGPHPHQPALLLFFWILIFNNVNDFSDFKLEFVHVLSLIFVSSFHLVEDARWKVISCGTSWNVIWVTRSIGLWVAVWLRQVSHWFVVILRRGQASTVLLGASAAVSG